MVKIRLLEQKVRNFADQVLGLINRSFSGRGEVHVVDEDLARVDFSVDDGQDSVLLNLFIRDTGQGVSLELETGGGDFLGNKRIRSFDSREVQSFIEDALDENGISVRMESSARRRTGRNTITEVRSLIQRHID